MTLYFIGLGLFDEKDISIKGLEIIKKCKYVFLENYTCKLHTSIKKMEDLYSKEIILADREMVESTSETSILKHAIDNDVAFLVIGDPMSATTHTDLWLRCKELSIKTKFIPNASIFTAVGVTGLQLYKFGKTSSIVFPEPNWLPQTPYDTIKLNKEHNLHTLLLLDIKVKESSKADIRKNKDNFLPSRYMTVNEGIKALFDIEEIRKEGVFTDETLCIGCARLGSDDPTIIFGKAKDLLTRDFKEALHCIIVPAKMHFLEEEAVNNYS